VKHYMLKYNHIFTPHIREACVTYSSCIYIGSRIAHIELQVTQFTQVTSSISLLEYMLVYISTYSYIAYSYGVKCSCTGHTSEPLALSLASYHNLVFQHRLRKLTTPHFSPRSTGTNKSSVKTRLAGRCYIYI